VAQLQDEPFEKVVDDKDMMEVFSMVERVYGVVQCNHCRFWGRMDGYIEPHDRGVIKFACPECKALEVVANPEAKQ
jgi:hypothetical protein